MQLTLSWDLLVIIFFATIITYSFIVGRDAAVKIIIATYIAVVSVAGLGNILLSIAGDTPTATLSVVGIGMNAQYAALTKIGLFVAVILFLALRGGFTMHYVKDIPGIWDTLLTGIFGFATAGLVLSTLLTYIAGRPILDTGLASAPPLSPLLAQSTLIQTMVGYQDLWFTFPALLLLGMGFFRAQTEE